MLLRSSSTPVLGSLLSSFSDSPSNHEPNTTLKHQTSINRFPLYNGGRNLKPVSCNSSPISPSVAESPFKSGFRRVQSDGNLEGLAYACGNNDEENSNVSQPKKFPGRAKCLMLETIPSYSFHNSTFDSEDDEEDNELGEEDKAQFKDNVVEDGKFGLSNKMGNLVIKEVEFKGRDFEVEVGEESGSIREQMYLATEIGIGGGGGGGRSDELSSTGGDGDNMHSMEEFYKRMVQQDPANPLFLRNYAQFLYQTKKDHEGAEQFYSRAILADPKDGEVLSQYAKLVWEFHHDEIRASSYHERAVQASPGDSHVHAAYANFLWEIEEDANECEVPRELDVMPSNFNEGAMASAGA